MKRKRVKTQTKQEASKSAPSELPTFLEHVYELRRRLFWVVAIILLASGAAYPFLDSIIKITTAPLGGQQLYYLTPVGGFSFSIKICFYVGIIAAVPFIMYHIFRYLEPLMNGNFKRSALFYVGFSTALAALGVLFAYFVALPGALRFLTGMDLSNIQAMLTVDSYLSFVMTYLLGSALVFQIPFLFSIINTATPLKPGKLMKMQRYVIVAAFVIAAVISPTPDIMNQALMALPIILMYQFGVIIVWAQNKGRNRKKPTSDLTFAVKPEKIQPQPSQYANSPAPQQVVVKQQVRRPSVDGFITTSQPMQKPAPQQQFHVQTMRLAKQRPARTPITTRPLRVPTRSLDGFALRRTEDT